MENANKPIDLKSICIAMLQKGEESDSLYEVSRILLESINGPDATIYVVQNDANGDDCLQGLESRTRAKGPLRAFQVGLLQTVERLKFTGGK